MSSDGHFYYDRVSVKHQKHITGMYLFSIDFRNQNPINRGSFASVVDICRPLWNDMSVDKKNRYDTLATEVKALWLRKGGNKHGHPGPESSGGIHVSRGGRLDNRRLLIDDREEADAAERLTESNQEFIRTLFSSPENVPDDVFMMIDVVCMLENKIPSHTPSYLPAEVSLFLYTIRSGVTKTYHQFINPGPIPLGYHARYQEYQKYHCIEENSPEMENNVETVFEDVCGIVNNCPELIRSRKLRLLPVFCISSEIDKNQIAIDFIVQKHRQATQDDPGFSIKVYPVEYLITDLMMYKSSQAIIDVEMVRDNLLQEEFEYVDKIRCKLHDDHEAQVCSYAVCKQLCFKMSSMLIKLYGVPLTVAHFPTVLSPDYQAGVKLGVNYSFAPFNSASAASLGAPQNQFNGRGQENPPAPGAASQYSVDDTSDRMSTFSFSSSTCLGRGAPRPMVLPPGMAISTAHSRSDWRDADTASSSTSVTYGRGRGRFSVADTSDTMSTPSLGVTGLGRVASRPMVPRPGTVDSRSDWGDADTSTSVEYGRARGRGRGHNFGTTPPSTILRGMADLNIPQQLLVRLIGMLPDADQLELSRANYNFRELCFDRQFFNSMVLKIDTMKLSKNEGLVDGSALVRGNVSQLVWISGDSANWTLLRSILVGNPSITSISFDVGKGYAKLLHLTPLQNVSHLRLVSWGTTRIDSLIQLLSGSRIITVSISPDDHRPDISLSSILVRLINGHHSTLQALEGVFDRVSNLETCTNLQSIKVTGPATPVMNQLRLLPELAALDCDLPLEHDLFSFVDVCVGRLKYLRVNHMSDRILQRLGRTMEHLEVSPCNDMVTDVGIVSLSNCHRLTHISLKFHWTRPQPFISDASLRAISKPWLCHLTLDGYCNVTDDGIFCLAHIPGLKHLDIHCAKKVTGITMTAFPALQHLDVTGTNFNDAGMVALSASGHKLRALYLGGCIAVSDIGMCIFAPTAPHLAVLHVNQCDVGDITLSRLTEYCPLTRIDVRACRAVTETGLAIARNNCPLLLLIQS